VVAVLMLVAVVEVAGTALFQLLFSRGRIWLQVYIVLIWSGLLCGGTAILTPNLGALGIALSYLVAYTANVVFYALAVRRLLFEGKEVC
jgi:hypothetical protein